MMANDKRRDTLTYWEARLKRMGLSMEAGQAVTPDKSQPGGFLRWLEYGHTVKDLDFDGRKTYRVLPSGESLELGEWPVSLC